MPSKKKPAKSSFSQQNKRKLIHLSGLSSGEELIPECEVITDDEGDSSEESSDEAQDNRPQLLHFSGLPVGEELIPECEVVYITYEDTLDDCRKDCDKNPGHKTFIPVDQFGFEHLPEELRNEKIMSSIKKRCNRTVRIMVRYTSENRPDTFSDNNTSYPYSNLKGFKRMRRYGTGFIADYPRKKMCQKCSCSLCRKADDPKLEYWEFLVKTATHVIYDDLEAAKAEFDCFFDSEDGEGVKKLYGVRTVQELRTQGSAYKSDISLVVCVTHEEETMKQLLKEFKCTVDDVFETFDYLWLPPEEVIVSHPHGCSKCITVGKSDSLTFLFKDNRTSNIHNLFLRHSICRIPMIDKHNKSCKELSKFFLNEQTENLTEAFTPLPYLRSKSSETNSDEGNVYNIIVGIAYDLFRFAVMNDQVPSVLMSVDRIDHELSLLMSQRLNNTRFTQSGAELIDVGFLLWKSYFILVKDFLKDWTVEEKNSFSLNNNMVSTFLENIYELKRELLPTFNVRQYISEKSQECGISDRLYSDLDDAQKQTVRLLTHGCSVIEKDDKNMQDVMMDVDNSTDDENMDNNADSVFQTLLSFFTTANAMLQSIHERHQLFDKMKVDLITPETENNFLQPGKMFRLPGGISFTLPPKSEYFCKYYKGNPGYYTLPPGTKFTWTHPEREVKLNFPLPDETQYINTSFDLEVKFIKNYSMDLCPGCSGAHLYCDMPLSGMNTYTQVHSGSVGNINHSGVVSRYSNLIGKNNFLNHMKENVQIPS